VTIPNCFPHLGLRPTIVIIAPTLPQCYRALTVPFHLQFLKKVAVGCTQLFKDLLSRDSLNLTYHGSELDIVRRNQDEVDVLGHDHVAVQAKFAIFANLPDSVNDGISEAIVG
jgi:hypothetical protein